jgi:single-strand DNA-binding protein
MSVNQIYLLGRCGKDAEVRMAGQNKVATFSLCTGGKYKTNDGREIDDTAWHNIVAWRNLAELAEKYIRKGSQILVIGRLTYRKYTGNDGVERNVTEIIADKIELCGAKESAPSQSPAPSPAPAQQRPQTTAMPYPTETDDSDLPFN